MIIPYLAESLLTAEEPLDYPINPTDESFTVADFLDAVRNGHFNEDDGIGIYLDDNGNSLGNVWIVNLPRNAVKVAWYSK